MHVINAGVDDADLDAFAGKPLGPGVRNADLLQRVDVVNRVYYDFF